ncbi:hypothetical protein B5F09_10525, partial [Erysipelatoclostridium sp. An173]|uniref:leucine-rich repeat protein n=1 Tax=Erysipelatoclostridium sp. An173 TaxID=1965571 RepID=UPI000B580BFF
TVTVIGNTAFGYSSNLSQVEFGENVEEIGDHAFRKCGKITKIELKDKVTKIGVASFAECTELSDVKLPKSLEVMYAHAFYNCDKITEIEIPKSLVKTETAYIYEYAGGHVHGPFYGCDGLKNITFEKGITTIAKGLFANCPAITEITIPETIIEICDYAFENCDNLLVLDIPDNVEKFDISAVENCDNITVICNYGSPFHISTIENNVSVKLKTYKYDDYSDLAIESDCNYAVDYNALNVNGCVKVNVDYNIKEDIFLDSKNRMIIFYIPENSRIYEEQIRVNGEFCYDYTIDGRKLIIDVTEANGDISFGFAPNSVESLSTAAIYQYQLDGKVQKELLGFDNSSRSLLTIETNTTTSKPSIMVQGLGSTSIPVDLYIDDEFQTTVTTLKTGKYQAELSLPSVENGKNYTIKAVNANDETQTTEVNVLYTTAIPEMTEFKLYYNNHSDTMIDLMNAKSSPRISFNPEIPFTFVTDFTNDETINNVYIVSTRNNERKIIEAEYNENTGQYIASGYFDESNHSYVPGKLSVEYNVKQEEVKVGQEFDWEARYTETSDDLKKTQVSMIENSGNNTSYRFDFSDVSADLAGVSIDMAISQLDAADGTDVGEWLGIFKDTFDVSAMLIPGLDDSKYLFASDRSSTEAVIIIAKEGLELVDGAVKLTLKLNPTGSYTKLSDLSPYLGVLAKGASTASEIYDFYQDKEALINEIYQTPGITDKSEAVRRAEALFEDQKNYTIMMALLPLLAASFGVTAPVALVFSGMLEMIGSTSTYFWEMRTYCIKNGYDIYGIDWKIDPSGYVYEAVENNRLEGVKTTAYYKENLEDTEAILWDASEYEQMNPLYTDSEGRYAWDVPEGYWQVKYEKEGYETVYSEWLPVPPPQTEVNIGMISKEKPMVENISVYADYVNIVFSKYMKPETISSIKITDDKGNNIPYILEYDQSKVNPEGVNYAKEYVLRFTNNQLLTPGSTCNIAMDETLRSYADISIDSYNQILLVNKNTEIVTTDNVDIKMGDSIFVPVQVINLTDDYSISVSSDSDEIVSISNVSIDGFTINANMYGKVDITITIPETELRKVITVFVGKVTEDVNILPTIVIDQSAYILNVNDTIEITPKVYPKANVSGKWSILSGEKIISINGNNIKANKAGEAVIRYTLDEYEDIYVDCKIIVKSEYLLGDVNNDNLINYSDAVILLQADSKLIELTELQKSVADVNKDKIVDYNDAVQILRYDAGIITGFE